MHYLAFFYHICLNKSINLRIIEIHFFYPTLDISFHDIKSVVIFKYLNPYWKCVFPESSIKTMYIPYKILILN